MSRLQQTAPWRLLPILTGIGMAGTIVLSPSFANFTSSDWRAVGFCVADGVHDGVPPDATQAFQIQQAIDQLATLPGMAECADCLRDMSTNGRICIETGTANSTNYATTLPDKQPGCNPCAEGVHLSPDLLANEPIEVVVCLLAHEWFHTNQDEEDYEGNFEKEAYQAEIDCLKALGAENPGSPAHCRLMLVEECLKALCMPAAQPGRDSPGNGGQGCVDGGDYYLVTACRVELLSSPGGSGEINSYPLRMSQVYSLLLLHPEEAEHGVALVGGVRLLEGGSFEGVIQVLAVDEGRVVTELFELTLPQAAAFQMAADASRGLVYVLDPEQKQVLVVEDTDADSIPDRVVATPFATADDFPAMRRALGIALNPSAEGRGVFLDFRDTRYLGAVPLQGERAVLLDRDEDGVFEEGRIVRRCNLIACEPGYMVEPRPGDREVRVFAGGGAPVEVQLTDSTATTNLGRLGHGRVPLGESEVVIALLEPLPNGVYVRTLDTDNPHLRPRQGLWISDAPADWSIYGEGVPGTSGIPIQKLNADPVQGTVVEYFLMNCSDGPTTGVLLLGSPVDGGANGLVVAPVLSVPVEIPAEGLELRLAIPGSVEFRGLSFAIQALMADPAAPGGTARSRGLLLEVGDG